MKPQNLLRLTALLAVFISSKLSAHPCEITFDGRNDSSLRESSIEYELKAYINSLSLSPILDKEDHLRFVCEQISEDPRTGKVCLLGVLLTDNGKPLSRAFFTIEKGWFYNSTQLEYLTITDNLFPEPTLINDIRRGLMSVLPSIDENHFFVISELEGAPERYVGQIWTCFAQDRQYSKIVVLRKCADGGMDYVIMDVPDDLMPKFIKQ